MIIDDKIFEIELIIRKLNSGMTEESFSVSVERSESNDDIY